MKPHWKLLVIFSFLQFCNNLQAQVHLPVFHDSLFSTYYHQRVSYFGAMPEVKDEVIFLGNSITDGAEWAQLFGNLRVVNQGISGDVTAGVLHRLDDVSIRKPSKVFLLIGINDLASGISPDSILTNILLIADYLKQQSPLTKLFVQSILPVNDMYGKFGEHTKNSKAILRVNNQLKANAANYPYQYIDLFSAFAGADGKLKPELSNDGLHLMGVAYQLWKHIIFPYVMDVQSKPSIIPLPQQLEWMEGYFTMYNCKTLVVKDPTLLAPVMQLQQQLKEKGVPMEITEKITTGKVYIEFSLDRIAAPHNKKEAYKLTVNSNRIKISANTPHGIFNGIQTLKQLMRDDALIDACSIADWPAFGWRGYMIDVGRNYVSMPLLKQQIDAMAHYKMNIFHFHPTEDIAWRIAIKRYPQLTAPEHMQRNKGMYYTESEIKDLIQYCKERYITFLPEIDMPGHSAAFRRAMNTDMQSDSGVLIVKNILREFCETYDVPYIHIGADEVKISNPAFIPEVTKLIESYGKKVIGWQPGGNFSNSTIRQLWMDDNAYLSDGGKIKVIDSRHLYLNHMDPLEAITTLFNRQIGDTTHETSNILGGTLCLWHDRTVSGEADIMNMNPVYPGMLTFAERTWIGGGQKGWISNISDGNEKQFADFEERLLGHKKLYFQNQPFPYVKQSHLQWKIFGPFNNEGNLQKKFDPESPAWLPDSANKVYKVTGGTVVLRHWWYPLIKGAIDQPVENSTWYAMARLWSPIDTIAPVWIGFNNLSRSPATDSPPANEWDAKFSRIWVNGEIINSPDWKHPGQRGNSEIPLADEGYEYRAPSKIAMKKGWNTILVKLPVGSFKGKDWQNPVKWMFTFVPAF